MKIRYQLWLIFAGLFITFSFALYMVIANSYEERLQAGYEQIALAQGSIILDKVAGTYPESQQRSIGYLQKYSEQLKARLIVLNEDKSVFADSFAELKQGTTLKLAILEQEGYASDFLYTDDFGYLQYTLLPFKAAVNQGYLLMIQPAEMLYAELSSFRYWVLQALLLSLLIFFILSYVVSTWLTKPIGQIITALKKITPRKRFFSLTYRRQNEIKELIDAIQRMVEELNLYDERQQRFLSTSSHELKTPLATMQLILENLPYVRENEEKYLEFTHDLTLQVQKMKQMVEQLLQITRLGKAPLKKEIISEQDIGEHLLQSFQYLAKNKNIVLQFKLQKAFFNVDKRLFFRALDNLVANAIRYSPAETVVTIKTKSLKEENIVSVFDQGIGISPSDLPHIFDPFFRANDATAWSQEGSGLGLAIVKQIIELHRGKITVNSKPEKGTSVYLTLPRPK
ncbi:MAG: HAMP domain-containing histidine kinase [Firmicutes bacterium]|nr:HAMP domain-containing histidine kinase [Bacillota bacterium]